MGLSWFEALFGCKRKSKPLPNKKRVRSQYESLARDIYGDATYAALTGADSTADSSPRAGDVRLGIATGKLTSRGHISVPRRGTPIDLTPNVMSCGMVVIGRMGTGKSRTVLQPFARDFLADPEAGLFAYGVKPNWSRILARIAKYAGRKQDQIHILGPDHDQWRILSGLPPESVSTFAKAAFELGAKAAGGDTFFKDSAQNLLRSAAQILAAACAGALPDPLHFDVVVYTKVKKGRPPVAPTITQYDLTYDLQSISEVVHAIKSPAIWAALVSAAADRVTDLTAIGTIAASDDAEMIDLAVKAITRTLIGNAAHETTDSVVMQIDTVIEPFISSAPLRRAFCGREPKNEFNLASALSRGHTVIVDVNLGEYDAAARLVYLLAFEQLRVYMLARIAGPAADLNPIAFIADEYAEVVSREHAKMWRVCREAHISPVVAYQLHSDMEATLGSKAGANSLVNGFDTTVLLRTGDAESVALLNGALGKAEVERESEAVASGINQTTSLGGGNNSKGQNQNRTSTTNLQERAVVDAQLVQSLRSQFVRGTPFDEQFAEAIVVTTLGGVAVADIVTLHAWDPPEEGEHK